MECQQDQNLVRCNCSYEPCDKKGICCECLNYHLKMRQLPGCCFPDDVEKTWERSFETFAKLVRENKILPTRSPKELANIFDSMSDSTLR